MLFLYLSQMSDTELFEMFESSQGVSKSLKLGGVAFSYLQLPYSFGAMLEMAEYFMLGIPSIIQSKNFTIKSQFLRVSKTFRLFNKN